MRCRFDLGQLRLKQEEIALVTVHLHPPIVASGGTHCGVVDCCDLLAHTTPQGTSAWRNLITLFSSVNNLSQSFFIATRCHAITHCHSLPKQYVSSHSQLHSKTLPTLRIARRDAAFRKIPSLLHHTATAYDASQTSAQRSATRMKNFYRDARSFRVAQVRMREICAVIFTAHCNFARACGMKKPASLPTRVVVCTRAETISARRFPAARRNRPGLAGHPTGPHHSTPPRTTSRHRKHLR